MIAEQTRNSYSEIFQLLKYIDRTDLNKIPMYLLETIKENRNKEYNPKIDFSNLEKSLSKKARALYMGLYLNYLTQNQKEKNEIYKTLYENEIKIFDNSSFQNDIFKGRKEENMVENNKLPIEYKKNIFIRIVEKIKNIFRGDKR